MSLFHPPGPTGVFGSGSDAPWGVPTARLLGLCAAAASLVTSLVLLLLYRELSGPGDQIGYYEQAANLLPYNDHYYGPGYYIALRALHDVTGLSWFMTGKLLSWISAFGFLYFTYRFLAALLPPVAAWLSFVLVALNPTVIGESYSSLTMMFGAALLMLSIWLTVHTSSDRVAPWFLVGLVFGFAALTRFQSLGFVAGAAAGACALASVPWSMRLRIAGVMILGAAAPITLWSVVLLLTQGYIPANHNFVHLTYALGKFKSFNEVPDLVRTYGSVWGVVTSDRFAAARIVAFAVKRAVLFPFYVGFPLLFLSAGFLLPGALRLVTQRDAYAPWLGAFVSGLVLTGIGSDHLLHYYTVIVPFAALLVAQALISLRSSAPGVAERVGWAGLLLTTLVWGTARIRSDFLGRHWSEFTVARAWIERRDQQALVSSTALSLKHSSRFPFIDLNALLAPREWDQVVDRLRAAGVQYLVVTERHEVDEFPQFAAMLEDVPTQVPPGLRRDTLITSPKRLGIFRVMPGPPAVSPHSTEMPAPAR